MDKSKPKVPEDMRRTADEARKLFSNSGQTLQERTAVAGLLRVLGVAFRPDELIKKGPEPIDVWFRQARFQVTEILDPGRRRNREIGQLADRINNAASLHDLCTPGVVSSRPLSPTELFELILKRSREKAGACPNVDLLIYVNLRARHLYPAGPLPDAVSLASTGWRSVSVIMERFALIPWAAPSAPDFLLLRKGQVIEWPSIESVFPVLSDG